jgi:hypothetical protein
MAEAAKVIRIELRVGGGSGGDSSRTRKIKGIKKPKSIPKSETVLGRLDLKTNKLAGAGAITLATHLLSEAFSIAETLSYNSEEKTNMMFLGMGKTAISTALVAGGYILGGPVGTALGMAINELLVKPVSKGGEINIQRNLDYTRATNRFYLTDFAGKGNYTFNYANGSYVNEDLEKVRKSSFYIKGGAI